MRKDRLPNRSVRPHSLVSARKGTNRYAPGKYICSCGQPFTGLNAYEKHRADERKRGESS
jgi:hypothetical protein